MCIGNAVVIWLVGMLLYVYWECCCYLGSWNDVVICVLGMMLLFVYWELFCYLCIVNAVIMFALGILFLFGQWKCCSLCNRNVVIICVL